MKAVEVRRCALTGVQAPPSALLRFVLSPQGKWVFDRKQDLPAAEENWLSPSRKVVGEWAARQTGAEALAAEVERQLRQQALGNLALLRRSGGVISGFEKVKIALKKGGVAVLVQAADAAADGKEKLAKLASHHHIEIIGCFLREELAQVTGQENQAHLALLESGLSEKFLNESGLLLSYLEDDATSSA